MDQATYPGGRQSSFTPSPQSASRPPSSLRNSMGHKPLVKALPSWSWRFTNLTSRPTRRCRIFQFRLWLLEPESSGMVRIAQPSCMTSYSKNLGPRKYGSLACIESRVIYIIKSMSVGCRTFVTSDALRPKRLWSMPPGTPLLGCLCWLCTRPYADHGSLVHK